VDRDVQFYKWAVIGCVVTDVALLAFVAFMIATTGSSNWAWLLLALLFNSPSLCSLLAKEALAEGV
jgi:hypothetical protein